MPIKDSKNDFEIVPSILPEAVTASKTGAAVDIRGFNSVTVSLTATTASVGGTFKLTESATVGGSYTDVVAADIIGTQGVAAVEDKTVTLGYVGGLDFIKAVFTHSADGVISADVIKSLPLVGKTGANG